MATQVRIYQIKWREHLMDDFHDLQDSASSNLAELEHQARDFAVANPGALVQIHSNTDGFEVQYRYRDEQMYRSFGHGWHPYE